AGRRPRGRARALQKRSRLGDVDITESVADRRCRYLRPGVFVELNLVSHAPVSHVRLADVVAGRVRRDELGPPVAADEDGVLTKYSPAGDGFVALHAVDEPGRLAPRAFRLLFVAHASLDPVAAEDQQVPQHEVAALVDLARQEHRTRVVRGEHG